eukprot:UN04370
MDMSLRVYFYRVILNSFLFYNPPAHHNNHVFRIYMYPNVLSSKLYIIVQNNLYWYNEFYD